MITHNQLIFVLARKQSGVSVLDHGRMFWVGMPVDGPDQKGDAFIAAWSYKDIPKPTEAEYTAWCAEQEMAQAWADKQAADIHAASVPQAVSRAQGKAALIGAGLWPQVVAFVDAIPDATQKALAEVALNDTTEWRRDSPFLAQASAALGVTAEQMDALFVQAAGIQL